MSDKEHIFYGIVADIGDERKGKKSTFYPITMADGKGEELQFLLFDNQENELQMVEESLENAMTLEITYTENRSGGKTYTNIVKGGITWADEADKVEPGEVETAQKQAKGKEAQTHIAQRKGKEAFEPAINQQKQADIRQSVALQEVGVTFTAVIKEGSLLKLDALLKMYPSFKDSLDAYFRYITVNLSMREHNLVEVAQEVLGAVETSRQHLSKPTKTQLTAIKRLLEEQIGGEEVDLKAVAVAKYGKGVKMTGDNARDWIHELQGTKAETPVHEDTPPAEDSPEDITPEELPF